MQQDFILCRTHRGHCWLSASRPFSRHHCIHLSSDAVNSTSSLCDIGTAAAAILVAGTPVTSSFRALRCSANMKAVTLGQAPTRGKLSSNNSIWTHLICIWESSVKQYKPVSVSYIPAWAAQDIPTDDCSFLLQLSSAWDTRSVSDRSSSADFSCWV